MALHRSPKSSARKSARRSAHSSTKPVESAFDWKCVPTEFSTNDIVFGEGEGADNFYEVVTGCIRTHSILSDARRHVGAFYLPGDFFGLDARKTHNASAEAICRSTIRIFKRKSLMSRGKSDAIRRLFDLTVDELERTKDHNLLLLMSAENRVIVFLLDMARRHQAQSEFELPMTRRDIADYLGLTIETVSRMFSRLANISIISLPTPWRIVLQNQSLLHSPEIVP